MDISKEIMDLPDNQPNSPISDVELSEKRKQRRKVICPECGKLQYKHNLQKHILSQNCREEDSPVPIKDDTDGKVRFGIKCNLFLQYMYSKKFAFFYPARLQLVPKFSARTARDQYPSLT